MPQFDVYRTAEGELLIDCQSDALAHLGTRLVAPLRPHDRSPPTRPRLNPIFEIGGERHVMVTQFAAAVDARILLTHVLDLSRSRYEIVGALDMLLTGV